MSKVIGKLGIVIPKMVSDDYDVRTTELRSLPYPGGNMMLSHRSYLRVAGERKAEGVKCPDWNQLPLVYRNGKYIA